MFGFRRVRPPLTTVQRVNIELLMRRTIEQIGERSVRECRVVTDLGELQLDDSEPQRMLNSAREALEERMPKVPAFDLLAVDQAQIDFPSAYQPSTSDSSASIRVARDLLSDPLRTTMEISYQFANHYWHAQPAVNEIDKDPKTTNLLPICCGLGVLASDASLYDQQWSQAGWSGWSMSRSGYYSAVELGYALALFARARGEVDPSWAQSLRLDSRDTAKVAWRYFAEHTRNGGSLLFDAVRIPTKASDEIQLASWLQGEDPAFALASGYALEGRQNLSPRAIEASIQATHGKDLHLVSTAARLLGAAHRSDTKADSRVQELVRHKSPAVCLAALHAAGDRAIPFEGFATRIGKLLDRMAGDSFALVDVIKTQGKGCSFLAPKICEHAGRAIAANDDELASALIECLQRIVDDPQRCITEKIRSPEIREGALERLSVVT